MRFYNLDEIPNLLVLLSLTVKQSYGAQSNGQLYNKAENQEMIGVEMTSLAVRFFGDCALECNANSECHSFVVYPEVNSMRRCSLYNCKETHLKNRTQGVTTYIKVVATVTTCPAGFSPGPCGQCYQHVQTKRSEQQARDHCSTSTPGAYLAEVGSLKENDHILSIIDIWTWIGGRKLYGTWTWPQSGQAINLGFSGWKTGEPNGDGECMNMFPVDGQWTDFPCYATLKSVCEYGG